MAKNYMKEVAKMLGLSLGEEFKLKIRETEIAHSVVYHFTNRGLFTGNEVKCSGDTLTEILVGVYKVVKPPFKPKDGERYWYVSGNPEHGYATYLTTWRDRVLDKQYFIAGNCFRTEEEANQHKAEFLTELEELVSERENGKII